MNPGQFLQGFGQANPLPELDIYRQRPHRPAVDKGIEIPAARPRDPGQPSGHRRYPRQ